MGKAKGAGPVTNHNMRRKPGDALPHTMPVAKESGIEAFERCQCT